MHASRSHRALRAPHAARQRLLVLGSGVAALAACGVIAAADPSVPGRYGICPFLLATGLWCPVCGSLRAVHLATRGDVVGAAGSNLLLVLAAPALAYAWLAWALPTFGVRGPPRVRLPRWAWWAMLGALLVFGVLRNLEGFAWLSPEAVWTPR